jgi:DNA-binding response OmpR family regulator
MFEAETILAAWRPDLTVIDMDHEDSTALLKRLGASNGHRRRESPVLGLTKWGDLKSKLRAFELGVDDIMSTPFSPEELLARAIAITRRTTGTNRQIVRRSHSAMSRSTSSIARCASVNRWST